MRDLGQPLRGQVPWALAESLSCRRAVPVVPSLPGPPPPELCSAHTSGLQKSMDDLKAPGYIGSGWRRYLLLSSSPALRGPEILGDSRES